MKFRKELSYQFHHIDKQALIKSSLVLGGIVLLSFFGSLLINKAWLEGVVISAGIRGPAILVVWKSLGIVLAPLSGSLTYIIGGGLYGIRWGVLYGVLGNMIGIALAYRIGRKRGTKGVRKLMGKDSTKQVLHLIEHLHDTKTLIISSIIFFPLSDLIQFAAGMSRLDFWKFFIISLLIQTIVSILPIFFGSRVL